MCFVDLERAFDRVPRRVMEWAMRKKGLPEILVKAVMSLYKRAETKVRVGSGLSKEFSVKVGVHQGSALSSLFVVSNGDRLSNEKCEESLDEANSLRRRFGPNGGNYERIEREL